MSTSGRGRFRRHLLGSVATQVLHDLACQVYTGVHRQEVDPTGRRLYKQIACRVEHEGNEAILRWANDFAAAYDGELHVVRVLPFLDSAGAVASLPERLRGDAIAHTREQIEQQFGHEGVRAKVSVLGGATEDVLPPFLKANEIDLLVTGRNRQQDVLGTWGLHRDVIDTLGCTPCPTILV